MGSMTDSPDHAIKLDQAYSDFLRGYFSTNQRKEKTKNAYCSDLAQFLEFTGNDLALPSLSGSVIENWAAHLREKGYAPASARRKMMALKIFCSYWLRKGEIKESPFWRVKLSFGRIEQLPRALTEIEMGTLLVHAQGRCSNTDSKDCPTSQKRFHDYQSIRNLALLDLLFATGMRVGEVSALDMQDFSIEENRFRVKGKGGIDRLAFVVDGQTVRIQQKHLEARKCINSKSPALFLNAAHNRLSTQGIANVLEQFCKGAGIERHITPHMIRHTVATLLLRNGVDIRVVQEFLGHASIATTQRYTHISKDHMIGVLRDHHPSFRLRHASGGEASKHETGAPNISCVS
jgi:integrase/recombinase XerD